MSTRALLVAAVLLAPVVAGSRGEAAPPSAGAPVAASHQVVVTGAGVATYPAFDPALARYAVTTSPATDGTITVSTTSSDPAAVVHVNGVSAPDGSRTVAGLEPGDEVTVFIDDAEGRSVHTYVYLPDDFPTLERVTGPGSAPTHSHVMLTLSLFQQPPAPYFETAVDAWGVPAHLATNRAGASMDLKQQPNGHFSVARGTGNPAFPDSDIVELDEQWREVGRHRATGLSHTDAHDSILLPDGSRYFLSYEPDGAGRIDAVVQHVSDSGQVLFEWNSRDHVPDTVAGSDPDYAHVNSLQVMQDRNLLVSFRHLSSVFKIARHDGEGHDGGDVLWKLGGRDSDFDFRTAEGDPAEGPCAQHTAAELPGGEIMVFDNGSAGGQRLCVDPTDPRGPTVDRQPTRVVAWSLAGDVATAVRDDEVGGRTSIFAGSAQDLGAGRVMVGWGPERAAIATELDADGDTRWELRDGDPEAVDRYFTYRAHALDLLDATPPVVSVEVPPDGATVVEGDRVDPLVECSDRGGSSLQTCDVTAADTRSVGVRTVTATARDGAGNLTTVTRRYRVVARHRPDASIRTAGTTRVVGADRYGAAPRQQVRITRARGPFLASVRVRNAGAGVDRVRLAPILRSRRFTVQPVGARTSPLLRPGRSWTTTVRVVPRASVRRGDRAVVRLDARSLRNDRRVDTVWLVAQRS